VVDRLWIEAVNDLVLVPNVWANYLGLVPNVLGKLVRQLGNKFNVERVKLNNKSKILVLAGVGMNAKDNADNIEWKRMLREIGVGFQFLKKALDIV
tara:strand:- start:342 stop:629 length:288 start_codon:yes stop_codon:yes gene_type:complete